MNLRQLSDLLKAADIKMSSNIRDAQDLLGQIREALALVEDELSLQSMSHDAGGTGDTVGGIKERGLSGPLKPGDDGDHHLTLNYSLDEDSYKVGRRRLSLTETEKQILDLLWQSMPRPLSREAIHAALYVEEEKPNLGGIDVFVSKLRQKLKLISAGHEFLESTRGKGWSLRAEYCGPRPRSAMKA